MTGSWVAAGGVFTLVFGSVAKFFLESQKNKRDALMDERKQQTLDRIADSNERAVIAQTEVKAALEKNDEVTKMRFETLLEEVRKSCRHPGGRIPFS